MSSRDNKLLLLSSSLFCVVLFVYQRIDNKHLSTAIGRLRRQQYNSSSAPLFSEQLGCCLLQLLHHDAHGEEPLSSSSSSGDTSS
jgi:hypothetical protein